MKQRKILLIGKTGDGKSSAGNTILRKEVFTSRASASSVTAKSVKGVGTINGRKVTVIDTPGFFDTDRDEKEILSEIYDCLLESAPAVHAIGLVLKVGRYTRHENEVVQQLLSLLKEDVLKHTVILFTFGDQLEGLTIEEFVKKNHKLQELVDKCEGRCHVIDNKHWNKRVLFSGYKSNRVQVEKMLDTIDKMVKKNGCYTSKQIQKVDEQIEKEVKNLPPGDQKNLTPEEKREKAKKILSQKMMNQVAGAVAGAVIGPLLCAGFAFASSAYLLQALGISDALKSKAADAAVAAFETAVTGGAAAGGGVTAAGGGAIAAGGGAAAAGGGAAAAGGGAAAAGGGAVAAGGGAVAAGGGAVAAGGGIAAVETGAVASGAAAAGTSIAAWFLGIAAVAAASVGAVTGWKAAEDADSVSDAINKAADANYENAKTIYEKINAFSKKKD